MCWIGWMCVWGVGSCGVLSMWSIWPIFIKIEYLGKNYDICLSRNFASWLLKFWFKGAYGWLNICDASSSKGHFGRKVEYELLMLGDHPIMWIKKDFQSR